MTKKEFAARNKKIVELHNSGVKTSSIAKTLGITNTTVSKVLCKSRTDDKQDLSATTRRSNSWRSRFSGLNEWIFDNDVNLRELSERTGIPMVTLNSNFGFAPSRVSDPAKHNIDIILDFTGLTYEQAFGEATSDADI